MMRDLLPMHEHAFLDAARKAAGGIRDFGDESFRQPLCVLIDAVANEGRLSPEGLFGWQQRTVQLLTHRLRMQELVRCHPEILEEPIERPLFIVGLQRTGTTKLQKVLACDPGWNTPFLWEALFPVPFPGEAPGDPRPRIEAARQWEKAFYEAVPQARAGHWMSAEEPEEETFAVEMSFRWTVPSTFVTVPSYLAWVESHSTAPTYVDLRRTLQVLQWRRGTCRPWLLKAPWHLGFLDAILEVFPDADVVQTHREPFESVASNCALMYIGLSIGRPGLDKREHGRSVLAMNARHMRAHLRQRDALARDPTIDVTYLDVVRNAIEVVRRIYAARSESLSKAAEQRMREWERDNAQGKHGKFDYSAADWSLDRAMVAEAFREYRARFGFRD